MNRTIEMSIEAMKQALEALESLFSGVADPDRAKRCSDAITTPPAAPVQEPQWKGDTPESQLPAHLKGKQRGPFGTLPPPSPPRPRTAAQPAPVQETFDHTQAAHDAMRFAMNRSSGAAKTAIEQRHSNAYDDYRETMRQAFEQQAAPVQEPVAVASDDSGIYEFWARNKEAEKQAGLKFLADATRFKVRLTKHDCKINNLPRELGGRWVALVAAEDDSHLQLTAAQRPVVEPHKWVGLTDEEIYAASKETYFAQKPVAAFARAIEAKLRAVNGFSCSATEKNGGQA
jgi:hypothetical protein